MKKVKLLIVLLLAIFMCVPATTYALSNFRADNSLTINEDFNDNSFFAGDNVNVDSYINGISFVAGNTLNVKGESDYLFIAGNSLNISNYSVKDIFAAGRAINITGTGVRNIYASAQTINIDSDATTVYVSGDDVTLKGVYDYVSVAANKVKIEGEITGKLTINESAKVEYVGESKAKEVETYKDEVDINKENIVAGFFALIVARIVAKVLSFINILIIGILFIAIFKKASDKVKKMPGSAGFIFGKFGKGLVMLILVPIVSFILLFTVIASSLGVVGFALYGLALYLSRFFAAYYIGTHVFENMNVYLAYFLSLFILTLLSIIPVVGWLLSLFMLGLGIGVIFETIKTEKKGK